jgi:hypothetical protein
VTIDPEGARPEQTIAEENEMKSLVLVSGVAVLAAGLSNSAFAQASGTPTSAFPTAAPHEIVYMNGVPCRTILGDGGQRRIVACAQ